MTDISLNRFPVNIEDEMKRSYMDYAMSVIIGRALPDVRDGLKPAHRRVLYGMRTMGLASNRAYRKCAKIVGEVMGNYHPHGDALDLRHAGAPGAGLQHALHPGRRPGKFRLRRRRSAGGHRYTEARLEAARRRDDGGSRQGDRRLRPQLTTRRPKSRPFFRRRSRTCWSTDPRASRSAWRRTFPPHNMREVIDGVIARDRAARAVEGGAAQARC